MNPRPQTLAAVALAVAVALSSLGLAADDPQPDFSSWLADADGMAEAVRLYQEQAQPIFVYFYTDWCPYCRQFERELLSHEVVEDYIDGVVAVRINPENGPNEAALGRRYGVQGFPMLFMLSPESKSWTLVERMELRDGKPVLKQPGAFVDSLKQASAR